MPTLDIPCPGTRLPLGATPGPACQPRGCSGDAVNLRDAELVFSLDRVKQICGSFSRDAVECLPGLSNASKGGNLPMYLTAETNDTTMEPASEQFSEPAHQLQSRQPEAGLLAGCSELILPNQGWDARSGSKPESLNAAGPLSSTTGNDSTRGNAPNTGSNPVHRGYRTPGTEGIIHGVGCSGDGRRTSGFRMDARLNLAGLGVEKMGSPDMESSNSFAVR